MCLRHRAYAIVLVINNNNNVSISNCHIFTQTIKYRTRHLTLCPFAYLHNSCLAFEYEKSPAILVWGTLTFDLWSDALIHSPQFSKRAWWDPVHIAIYLPLVYDKLTSLAQCPSLINEAGHKHIAKGFALSTTIWSFLEWLEESLKLQTALKTPHGEVKGWNRYEDSNMLQARSGIHTECHSIIAIVKHIWMPVILYSSIIIYSSLTTKWLWKSFH